MDIRGIIVKTHRMHVILQTLVLMARVLQIQMVILFAHVILGFDKIRKVSALTQYQETHVGNLELLIAVYTEIVSPCPEPVVKTFVNVSVILVMNQTIVQNYRILVYMRHVQNTEIPW
jgi:hypothetical protein